jgi:hypothetical protein
MNCSETDFKYPLAYARGSVFMPDHVTVAKYQKPCGVVRPARALMRFPRAGRSDGTVPEASILEDFKFSE